MNQLLKWPTEVHDLESKLKQLVSGKYPPLSLLLLYLPPSVAETSHSIFNLHLGLQKNELKNATAKPSTVPEPFNITKPKSPKSQQQPSPPTTATKVKIFTSILSLPLLFICHLLFLTLFQASEIFRQGQNITRAGE